MKKSLNITLRKSILDDILIEHDSPKNPVIEKVVKLLQKYATEKEVKTLGVLGMWDIEGLEESVLCEYRYWIVNLFASSPEVSINLVVDEKPTKAKLIQNDKIIELDLSNR